MANRKIEKMYPRNILKTLSENIVNRWTKEHSCKRVQVIIQDADEADLLTITLFNPSGNHAASFTTKEPTGASDLREYSEKLQKHCAYVMESVNIRRQELMSHDETKANLKIVGERLANKTEELARERADHEKTKAQLEAVSQKLVISQTAFDIELRKHEEGHSPTANGKQFIYEIKLTGPRGTADSEYLPPAHTIVATYGYDGKTFHIDQDQLQKLCVDSRTMDGFINELLARCLKKS